MKEYETLYLVLPDLPADKIEELNHKLAEAIKHHQGHVLTQFNWGKKRLAYRVGKHHHGIFIYLNYLAAGDTVAEVERILKYDDNILKFITVKLEDEVEVEKRLQEKRELILTSLDDSVKETREGAEPYGSVKGESHVS